MDDEGKLTRGIGHLARDVLFVVQWQIRLVYNDVSIMLQDDPLTLELSNPS